MNKTILITASVLGALAVALGAFAAHGLKASISQESLGTFETGVRYQFYYSLLLLFLGIQKMIPQKTKKAIYYLTIIGLLCFSGSIYGLSTNDLTSFDFRQIALITPLGGLMLISVWILLLISFSKTTSSKKQI